MHRNFTDIIVEIKDTTFEKNNLIFRKTALVKFIDEKKNITSESEYGYADQVHIENYIKDT